MDQLAYISDILTAINKYGVVSLFIVVIILLATLYLVWSLHSRLDTMAKNQKVLQDEIKELKGFFKGGKKDGEYS